MNSNAPNRWNEINNHEANFDYPSEKITRLKKCLSFMSLMCVVALLAACAAFSGRETAGEYVDDAGITGSVKSEIMQDPNLKMFQIHVETFQNQVQLSGFVDSQAEVERAGQIARNVQGVEGVKNNLVVRKKPLKKGKVR
jgi:hyperosmotically inducible protein